MRAILTIGISGSGKSTWAAEFVESRAPERWAVLNQDEMRLELIKEAKGAAIDEAAELKRWNYDKAGPDHQRLKARWDQRARQAIAQGFDGVIVSDTNLDGGAEKAGKLVELGVPPADISTREFPIALEEALARNANRAFSVAPEVVTVQHGVFAALRAARADKLKPKPKMG